MLREKRLISLSEYLAPSQDADHPVARSGTGTYGPIESSRELDNTRVETVDAASVERIVLLTDPRGPGADRFRFLRMRLRELAALVKLRTLVITSALPQDGKSTIALNLATAMAERGTRRVLLIEADLHRPSLAGYLGVTAAPGLAECLEAGLDPLSAISRLEPLKWYLMQAGQPNGNPSDLMHTPALKTLIEKLALYFDWILIDTPPVVPLSDALSVSQIADASLVVVRADYTPREAVEEAIAALGANHVAAIVFNGAESLNRLYSKYSGYYRSQSE